jgi:glucosamine--fructose-6-phosphate aminotransferase (isomerizing)
VVSQSGETADTLAALKHARALGQKRTLAICNVASSAMMRETRRRFLTHAGVEIGVASTKAFTAQLTALYLFGLFLGSLRGVLSPDDIRKGLADLVRVPALVEQCLEQNDAIERVARRFFQATDFLYLGRGPNYPVALEGALKLKEISYIHAEGYPAGEMKHGPIALIDEKMPVVVLAGRNNVYEKILANIQEVKARSGIVIAVANDGDLEIAKLVDHVITVPVTSPLLQPIVMSIPLQLLAYHIAVLRGADVDQPRNLAKSVTVE